MKRTYLNAILIKDPRNFIKTQLFVLPLLLMFSIILLSCESEKLEPMTDDEVKSVLLEVSPTPCTPATSPNELSATDKEGLLFMREEEKLARDVYAHFYNKYNLRVFKHISESESRHMAAVFTLLQHFGLEDPANNGPGKFSNTDLQQLYDQLIAEGTDAKAAIAIGAYIEEHDIQELKNYLELTNNADIIRVYTNLLRGSETHLKVYMKWISAWNIDYTPLSER